MGSESFSSAVCESLRHYYLDSMGIQSWQLYDGVSQDSAGDTLQTGHGVNEISSQEQSSATSLARLQSDIVTCRRCEFSNNVKQAVFGEGNVSASLMIIVLLPQPDGQMLSASEKTLLSKMLTAIDIDIDDVFITPLIKCPQQTECTMTTLDVQTCSAYIKQQIAFIQPSMLYVMGEEAAQCLLNSTDTIDELRSQDSRYQQLPTMISYSLNDLLLQPVHKKKAWVDLQNLKKSLQSHLVS